MTTYIETLRDENAIHEAGHYVIARARGYWGVTACLNSNGIGYTTSNPSNPIDNAVVTAAGSEAANLLYHGCDMGITAGDLSDLHDICPGAGIGIDEARAMAREAVLTHRGEIMAAAQRLKDHGHI